ncbi:MAG: hypothetical protein ACYC1D_05200, partial [Acidimicrobiales bacterium]
RGAPRDRRRRGGSASERVLGAWAELLDALADYRVATTSLTPSEVHHQLAQARPEAAPAAGPLPAMVDRVIYRGSADESDAAAAWAASVPAVAALRSGLARRARLRILLLGPPRPDSPTPRGGALSRWGSRRGVPRKQG